MQTEVIAVSPSTLKRPVSTFVLEHALELANVSVIGRRSRATSRFSRSKEEDKEEYRRARLHRRRHLGPNHHRPRDNFHAIAARPRHLTIPHPDSFPSAGCTGSRHGALRDRAHSRAIRAPRHATPCRVGATRCLRAILTPSVLFTTHRACASRGKRVFLCESQVDDGSWLSDVFYFSKIQLVYL